MIQNSGSLGRKQCRQRIDGHLRSRRPAREARKSDNRENQPIKAVKPLWQADHKFEKRQETQYGNKDRRQKIYKNTRRK